MIGAAAMSVSSIFVVCNALRLKFFRPTRAKSECADGACAIADKADGTAARGISDEISSDAENAINDVKRSENNMKTYVLSIEGMMCSHCTGRVGKALSGVDGVKNVEVSLEKKNAVVTADESVTADALKAAVEAQDYPVTEVREG